MNARPESQEDWWMWQLHRQLAAYMYNPSRAQASRLHFYLAAYRYFMGQGKELSAA